MATANISAARLRELLYNPETGVFTWRFSRKGRKGVAGSQAGTQHRKGYRYITLDRLRESEHRLAWLYVHGMLPCSEVDHINGNAMTTGWRICAWSIPQPTARTFMRPKHKTNLLAF